MQPTLLVDHQGIPLHYLANTNYAAWLNEQAERTKTWLSQTNFNGDGLAIIPDANGNVAQALFVCETPEDYFAAGDVISQLPVAQYQLLTTPDLAPAFAFAWAVGTYQFCRYNKKQKSLATLAITDPTLVEQALTQAGAIALVRDLINTPASDMMPEQLQLAMTELAQQFGAQTNFIVGEQLLVENYPTIHMVGRASVHAPRLLDLTWGDSCHPKITLVGKGVCFDSGGLDLKPASGMRFMKKDMGGAAHVLGLAQMIMASQLPIRLRVLVPAVENAVSNNAMRPGDVVTTRAGITVEIDNTDAEGRLVLCDALAEAETDDPELLIDFATLTGAMRVALGTELPGFFSTNTQIAQDITAAGLIISDPVWQMPLHQPYKAFLASEIADMTNCPAIPTGGAITAALYLQAFVKPSTDWLHFDIMAWNNRKQTGRPLGGEAFGIRAVFAYLQQRYQAN
jgi:leucyl aminopeptidase